MLSRSVRFQLLPQLGSAPSSEASWPGLALFTRQETSSPKAETEAKCPKSEAWHGSSTNWKQLLWRLQLLLGFMEEKKTKQKTEALFETFPLNAALLGEQSRPDGEGEGHPQLLQRFWRWAQHGDTLPLCPGGLRASQAPPLPAILGTGRCREVCHSERPAGSELSSGPAGGAVLRNIILASLQHRGAGGPCRGNPSPQAVTLVSWAVSNHRPRDSSAGAQAGYWFPWREQLEQRRQRVVLGIRGTKVQTDITMLSRRRLFCPMSQVQ